MAGDHCLYVVLGDRLPAVAEQELASYGLHVSNQCQGLLVAAQAFQICDVVK